MTTDHDLFSTETTGLAQVSRPQVIRLTDGDRFDLSIGPVRKDLSNKDLGNTGAGAELRMLAYNGSIPGPTLHVPQGAEITVDVRNDGDVETTVHWHGLRLENRFDGVPHETQEPIPVGGGYSCRVQFPDAGFYWYHPHMREDFAHEMGLYGTIVVEPTDPAYWPAVDRELDDRAGGVLVGARRPLIAFNVNLRGPLEAAREIAALVRERDGGFPGVRALGLELSRAGLVQVSMNVEDFEAAALHEIVARVEREAAERGAEVLGSELVGLMPAGAAVAAAGSALRIDGFEASKVLELRMLEE